MTKTKHIYLFILCCFVFNLYGQFPKKHLDLLSKINTKLSNSWTPEVEQQKPYPKKLLNLPEINVYLITYKTGTKIELDNEGVEIHLFNKKYKKQVKEFNWDRDGINEHLFLETLSYFVVIEYGTDFKETNTKLVTKLISELKVYFLENKQNL